MQIPVSQRRIVPGRPVCQKKYLMATLRPILEKALQQEFDAPPLLSLPQRQLCFQVDDVLKSILSGLESPANQAGFLLQVGYFRVASRFFPSALFRPEDWAFVVRRLRLTPVPLRSVAYADSTMRHHRRLILSYMQVMAFRGEVQQRCQDESDQLVAKGLRLPAVFGSLCDFLRRNRWEIPAYARLAHTINRSVNRFHADLDHRVSTHLQPDQKTLLATLLDQLFGEDGNAPANSPLVLTQLRDTNELLNVRAIRHNVGQLRYLKEVYSACQPVMQVLALPDALVESYALQVMRSRGWQVKQWKSRELYLLCFVQYQYFYVSDVLTKTFITAVQEHTHQCERKKDRHRLSNYQQNLEQLRHILSCYMQQASLIRNRQGKSADFQAWFVGAMDEDDQPITQSFLAQLPHVEELFEQLTAQVKDTDYLDQVEIQSLKLQTRVGDIMRYLELSVEPHATPLREALLYYQAHQGQLSDQAPTDFLPNKSRTAIKTKTGKLRVSLYKALLARYLVRGLKNGLVYVSNSHQHKSIDDYLIDERDWQSQKEALLHRAGLTHLADWSVVRDRLSAGLSTQLHQTADRIQSGKNQFFERRPNNSWRLTTPTLPEPETADIDVFPQDRIVSLFEVLETVNRSCGFVDSFQATRNRHGPQSPQPTLVLAGIMSLGCNITTGRFVKAAKNISGASLDTTVRNYFNSANLERANDRISSLIEQISRSGLIPLLETDRRSSSDGQKYKVAFNSIHSTYSSKYFGKEKGITIYSFINNVHNLFYSTVFSASDREAWYVIDGLLHNDVVRSGVHSTDSHGATEPIFAVSYLLGVDFQPRMSHLSQKLLYSLAEVDMSALRQVGCQVGPAVDERLLAYQWDRVLKLSVSFQLKHTLASLVMKRLNSYAGHNPLYRALGELGKLVRTGFILRYMDEEGLRHQIHQQQEKIESAQALSRAVAYGNNGVLQYANQEELLTLEGCKRLITNAIICWNYLYMSRLLLQATDSERSLLLRLLPRTSPVSWQHINFHGEFNLDEDEGRDPLEDSLNAILAYESAQGERPLS